MPLTVIDHPLAFEQLAIMRNEASKPEHFRAACKQLTKYVLYESYSNSATTTTTIKTPMIEAEVPVLNEPNPVVVGIWRAGQIMVDAVLDLLPESTVNHLGVFRDEETHQPEFYYKNINESLTERTVIIVDPMLATGGSAKFAIDTLKEHGAKSENIRLLCLIASAEGIKTIQDHDSKIAITVGAIDEKLNSDAYIVPGLGDAGDRINNTL